jgi:cob(I)alamin adenosyltransferase
MRLYTKGGDQGETRLRGGGRVGKDHDRVVAYGVVDELNAAIGLAEAAGDDAQWTAQLRRIQEDLFVIGSELASEEGTEVATRIGPDAYEQLERWIDGACEQVPPLRSFILPGGSELSARLHAACAVCRRAERSAVRLSRGAAVSPDALIYLNRLSDLLFALARLANQRAGIPEIPWSAGPS